jgi:hypothetical protein
MMPIIANLVCLRHDGIATYLGKNDGH